MEIFEVGQVGIFEENGGFMGAIKKTRYDGGVNPLIPLVRK